MRRRKTVIVLTVLVFAAAGAGFKFIPQQFFPTSDRSEILVDLWLPEGTSYQETEMQAKRLEERLLADKTWSLHCVRRRWHSPLLSSSRPAAQDAELRAIAGDAEGCEAARRHHRARAGASRERFPGRALKVDRLFLGPPVGWAVQLRVQGPDRDEVRRIADEVKKTTAANPLVFNVHDNWHEPAPALNLDIDQDRARAIGVTSAAIRQALQSSLSGRPLAEFRENDQTIGVVLARAGKRTKPDDGG